MCKITTAILFILSLPLTAVHSQSLSTQDSISIFYDSLFINMERSYVLRKEVDWQHIKPKIKEEALLASNLEASLTACTSLFDSIQADHCQIFSETGWYAKTPTKSYTVDDFNTSFLKKYETKPSFGTKILDKHYGYVLIPGMLLLGLNQDSLNSVAQNMYDAILEIDQQHTIKGWIIDLRFNIGGNVYPMLAALSHLLGNNIMYTLLDEDKKITMVHTLIDGGFYSGEKLEVKVKLAAKANTKIPVAFLLGKLTASAGEDIVIGFRGRDNVICIGEETAGYLSGNDEVHLPFGITMALTTGYIADRHQVYTKSIIPDIPIEKQDDFENLEKDGNVMEAMRFIDERRP